MPELPEVETVRTGLSRSWIGKRIDGVELRRAGLRFPFPDGLEERLTGQVITAIRRRAKYLLIDLDNGDILLSHLGMSGKWTLDANDCEGKHDHVVIHLDDGSMSVYNDPRRFGVLDIYRGDSHKLLDHLGPEPLEEWTANDLFQKLQRRKSPIKICILDQKVVVGVGNIYVCEALNRSKISPIRISNKITLKECAILVNEIKIILAEAIQAGGSTLRDFAGVDGTLGYFPHQFKVYDKEGSGCECGGIVERLIQGGRSTFWCASCQK
ncbi:MAG: bifunctional DNA-formamidopyrimidine glycosylase/DNA-(apurinic or apyrimidinic site) lyase [Euryarchaeota archaeon]|jgi:formamidopyrimidine-DNA glycosylase|nr:bifunctional DNA-formamidopyrimidine glycosylase/DNA-(apurinic or apyrimidinic site) lyase [Euryarchaeota archaeon]MBT4981802.1 bifunctional DNA-formamidopyrimidine glycosylase/DNA-(apurinic or apyrimidinic site) lyase [Euryarchaeota archaeon]MBT5184584.1 bifunctional DNA-formamidopyrimidine glycosylase/DNA-(apurinic or apyrimidinic site) lyase [Euryarchaeota archaeon]